MRYWRPKRVSPAEPHSFLCSFGYYEHSRGSFPVETVMRALDQVDTDSDKYKADL